MCFFHCLGSQASLQWLLHRNWRSINAVDLKTQPLAPFSRQAWAAVPRAADPEHNANIAFHQAILGQARNKTPALPIRNVHHSLFFNFLLIKKKLAYLKNICYLSSRLREIGGGGPDMLSGPSESQRPFRTSYCENCVDFWCIMRI